jgi:hypothetical protein
LIELGILGSLPSPGSAARTVLARFSPLPTKPAKRALPANQPFGINQNELKIHKKIVLPVLLELHKLRLMR